MRTFEEVSDFIKKEICARTLDEVAESLGVEVHTVKNWRRGDTFNRRVLEVLARWAGRRGRTLNWLLGEEEGAVYANWTGGTARTQEGYEGACLPEPERQPPGCVIVSQEQWGRVDWAVHLALQDMSEAHHGCVREFILRLSEVTRSQETAKKEQVKETMRARILEKKRLSYARRRRANTRGA